MKVIKLNKNVTIVFNDGMLLSNNNCTDNLYNEIINNQDNEEVVKSLLAPELYKKQEEVIIKTKLLEDFNNSEYLSVFGSSIYIKSISELTLPEDLAVAFYKAEQVDNEELIQTYLNFWTLCSLNPDSRARTNLFWFLNKYGMTISKSGLFVAYRNVNIKSEGNEINNDLAKFITEQYFRVKHKLKKSPKNYWVYGTGKDNYFISFNLSNPVGNLYELYNKLSIKEVSPVFTDARTGTFNIKIGKIVSMPREEVESNSEVLCSNGLHLGGKSWLKENYFGSTSLMCLVNPTDVCAIPKEDFYGKMRVCSYFPVQIVSRDSNGDIINEPLEDGFEDDFIDKITYTGDINNNDTSNYTISIPNIPELNRSNIINKLSEIKQSLNKYV